MACASTLWAECIRHIRGLLRRLTALKDSSESFAKAAVHCLIAHSDGRVCKSESQISREVCTYRIAPQAIGGEKYRKKVKSPGFEDVVGLLRSCQDVFDWFA